MSILDQLQEASYKGAKFLIGATRTDGGRKTAVHEFPNSDNREIEDLGLNRKSFSITGFIGNKNYFEDINRLLSKLDSEGPGILVHPWRGQIQVQLLNYTLNENPTELGKATFLMEFKALTEAVEPARSGDNLQLSQDSSEIILEQITSNISERFNVGRFFALNFTAAEGNILQSLAAFEENISVNIADLTKINDFTTFINLFREDVRQLILNPVALGLRYFDLFTLNSTFAATPERQLQVSDKLFQFGDGANQIPITTVQRRERALNQDLIIVAMKTNALRDAYIQSQIVEYVSDVQLDQREDDLEEKFQELSTLAEENPGLLPDETFSELQELRNLTREFFDDQRVQVFRIVDFNTVPTSATITSYRLYGTTDNAEGLVELNDTNDPTFLGGDIKVFGV